MHDSSSILERLHEIATVLSRPMATREFDDVLQAIPPILVDIFNVDHSTITLLDDGKRFFKVVAEHPRLSTGLVDEKIRIQDRAGQDSLVTRHVPIIADDLAVHPLIDESASFRQIVETLNIRSMLIVPMVADGETVGTIGLDRLSRPRPFSKEDVQLSQTVADRMAAFVATARLRQDQSRYERQARLLASASNRTSATARESEIAQTLFSNLREIVQFKKASLQKIEEGKRILLGGFGFDEHRSDPWHLRRVDSDPLIHEIVSSKKTRVLPDTAADKNWQKRSDTADVNSWIGVPLVLKGDTTGILTLDHDIPGFYADVSEATLSRLDELTGLAAREISDAEAREAAQHQVTALNIIRDYAEKIATKLDLDDLLRAVVVAVSQGLKSARCALFLLEDGDGRASLVQRAACEGDSCQSDRRQELPYPRDGKLPCPVHFSLQTGYPVLLTDLQNERRFDFTHEIYRDARSILVVPLAIADSRVGVVSAVDVRPGWFSEADRLLLETLARQAASAIERDYGLELVHSIGNKILAATEVDAVLEDVVSGAIKLTRTDSGVIYELSQDCSRVVGRFHPEGSEHPAPRLDDPTSITRLVISKKERIEIPDIDNDKRVNRKLRGQFRSMFAVPLLVEESVVGVLYLNGKKVRALTDTERSLLDTLAGQAALAIQRTRLYEVAQRWQTLAEQSPDGIVVLGTDEHSRRRITLANPAAIRLFGARSAADLHNTSILDYFEEGSRLVAERRLAKLERSEHIEPMVEMCILRASGERVDVEAYTQRVRGTDEIQAVFHDLTRTKELLREMHHRVRRSLNQIDGFLTWQEQFSNDKEVIHAFGTLRERIQAMALVHTILYKTGKESEVEMNMYLNSLGHAILKAHGRNQQSIARFSSPGVVLNEKLATACGLVVTELVSNSLLHAFPDKTTPDTGELISVSLRPYDDAFRLEVSDNGIGIHQNHKPSDDSMGLSLVNSLVTHDLKGSLTITSVSGTHFTIDFPRGRAPRNEQ